MWIDNNISYIVHTNTLHVFDVDDTLASLRSHSINLENISKLKIYMCKSIHTYRFCRKPNDIRERTVSINYHKIILLIELFYQDIEERRCNMTTHRRVTIISNINDCDMNIEVHRIVYFMGMTDYPKPFIERYSKQYIDNTIFCVIKDKSNNCKIMVEITKDSDLYVSMR